MKSEPADPTNVTVPLGAFSQAVTPGVIRCLATEIESKRSPEQPNCG